MIILGHGYETDYSGAMSMTLIILGHDTDVKKQMFADFLISLYIDSQSILE